MSDVNFQFVREYFELIAETAIFVFFVMTFVVQAFQIPTGSMESTLLVGDFLLVNKMSYARPYFPIEKVILPRKDLERHDIIVFKYPRELQKDFVKRIIALEGEKIEIKDKEVYVNDVSIDEGYKVHSDNQIIKKINHQPVRPVVVYHIDVDVYKSRAEYLRPGEVFVDIYILDSREE